MEEEEKSDYNAVLEFLFSLSSFQPFLLLPKKELRHAARSEPGMGRGELPYEVTVR